MVRKQYSVRSVPGAIRSMLVLAPLVLVLPVAYGQSAYDCQAEGNRDEPTRLELTLSKSSKKRLKEIKTDLEREAPLLKIRIEFLPFLDPPTNIGIGQCVPAETARWAMRQALYYNGGIDRVILQDVVPHHWVGIGTTKLAELSWMSITAGDLDRLMDPGLSDDQFHRLYRELARMTERKRPFGFDPIPYERPEGGQTTPVPDPSR